MIKAIKAGWLAWLAAQKKKQIAFLENSRREALYQIEDMKRDHERLLVKLAGIK